MNRQEFRELMGQILFAFLFLMLQLLGVLIVFKDQL